MRPRFDSSDSSGPRAGLRLDTSSTSSESDGEDDADAVLVRGKRTAARSDACCAAFAVPGCIARCASRNVFVGLGLVVAAGLLVLLASAFVTQLGMSMPSAMRPLARGAAVAGKTASAAATAAHRVVSAAHRGSGDAKSFERRFEPNNVRSSLVAATESEAQTLYAQKSAQRASDPPLSADAQEQEQAEKETRGRSSVAPTRSKRSTKRVSAGDDLRVLLHKLASGDHSVDDVYAEIAARHPETVRARSAVSAPSSLTHARLTSSGKGVASGARLRGSEEETGECSLCTVTFHANRAHNLTRSP